MPYQFVIPLEGCVYAVTYVIVYTIKYLIYKITQTIPLVQCLGREMSGKMLWYDNAGHTVMTISHIVI